MIEAFPNGAIMLLVLMSALLLTYGNVRYGKRQKAEKTNTEIPSATNESAMTIEAAHAQAPSEQVAPNTKLDT